MTSANNTRCDTGLFETLSRRVFVADGAMRAQLQDAGRLQEPAPTRSRRNTLGCNLVNVRDYVIADEICELAFTGSAIAKLVAVELGVQAWGDNVDFSGREALQRFRVPAGIRHARQSQGRLPLRKERT